MTRRISLRKKHQRGMTLVELLISMVVLAVGLAALLGLIMTAIANNGKAKVDTGATLVSQMVIETLAAQIQNPPPTLWPDITIKDCTNPAPVSLLVSGAPGGGAQLTAAGAIDWAGQSYAAVPAKYKMVYQSCGTGGVGTVYDVRWNVTALTPYSKQIIVSARPTGMNTTAFNSTKLFMAPVTLRTIALTN